MKIEQALTGERRGEAESQMCGDWQRGAGCATAEARGRGPAEMHMNEVADKRRCVVHGLAGDLLLFLLCRPLSLFFLCSPFDYASINSYSHLEPSVSRPITWFPYCFTTCPLVSHFPLRFPACPSLLCLVPLCPMSTPLWWPPPSFRTPR